MVMLAVCFLGSFGLSLVLVPTCRVVAHRTGRVAKPTADRWHRRPTALFGGVAIFIATMTALTVIRPLEDVAVYAITGVAMFLIGLFDDIVPLKPSTKFVAQLALASVVAFFGYRLEWVTSLTLDAILTIFWITGITNALNLLDNMDGLCAGVALIVGVSLLATLASGGVAAPAALYLAGLLGAVAGFLVFNIHPASIFMGDSGSLFIGFTLAVISLELPRARGSNLVAAVAVPVLVMLIPIFDTLLVTVMRLLSGRRASQGGRDHSSHRLVAVGLPEKTAVAVLWGLAALGATTAYALQRVPLGLGLVGVVLFAVSMTLFAVFLTRVRVYEGDDLLLMRSGRVTPFIVRFMHKRRVLEVLLDFCLITVAYYGAYRLRFEGELFSTYFPSFIGSLPMVLGIQLTMFFALGVYRGLWRHFSLMDGVVLAKAVALGTLTIACSVLYVFQFLDYSRAVLIMYATVLMLLTTGTRVSLRLMTEFVRRRHQGDRVLIYGADDKGVVAFRELLASERPAIRLLGFIDDDPAKQRTRLHGYPVVGGYDTLAALITTDAVDEVVISMRLPDRTRFEELEKLCAMHSVRLMRLQVHLSLVQEVS